MESNTNKPYKNNAKKLALKKLRKKLRKRLRKRKQIEEETKLVSNDKLDMCITSFSEDNKPQHAMKNQSIYANKYANVDHDKFIENSLVKSSIDFVNLEFCKKDKLNIGLSSFQNGSGEDDSDVICLGEITENTDLTNDHVEIKTGTNLNDTSSLTFIEKEHQSESSELREKTLDFISLVESGGDVIDKSTQLPTNSQLTTSNASEKPFCFNFSIPENEDVGLQENSNTIFVIDDSIISISNNEDDNNAIMSANENCTDVNQRKRKSSVIVIEDDVPSTSEQSKIIELLCIDSGFVKKHVKGCYDENKEIQLSCGKLENAKTKRKRLEKTKLKRLKKTKLKKLEKTKLKILEKTKLKTLKKTKLKTLKKTKLKRLEKTKINEVALNKLNIKSNGIMSCSDVNCINKQNTNVDFIQFTTQCVCSKINNTEQFVDSGASEELATSTQFQRQNKNENLVSEVNNNRLRNIIIDGSNVALRHSNGRKFSVKGLKIALDYFVQRGHKVIAFVPAYRLKNKRSSDQVLLNNLIEMRLVALTPSRVVNGMRITPYDDRFIIQYATLCNGIVVSNDHYRDLCNENNDFRNTIENRLLMYTWVDDTIMFPNDPLGRHGPDLETFLKY